MDMNRPTRRTTTPRTCNEETKRTMEEAKRHVIDSLESMRGGRARNRPLTPHHDLAARSREDLEQEVIGLRTELKHVRAASALVDHDMHRLEQKALEAISEAGRLRQKLDKMNAHSTATPGSLQDYIEEREDLLQRVDAAEQERILLTSALQDSEREIARLAKSLEQFTRQYCQE